MKLSFETEIMKGFKEIDAFFTSFFEEFTGKYALNCIQIKALLEISLSKSISIKDLCVKLGMSKSNLSPVCKNLENMGYIKKERSLNDQRVVNLEVAPKGEEIVKDLREKIGSWLGILFGKMTEDEKETVKNALQIISEVLNGR